ncbi:hypothetical protein O181_095232 [Austropuccinia psidii MF-1]|uniref:Uncharacterized protein n=1 Tax=Austropuccinia psidii MF-1 TaxID=1389203 RepID=A0A9Q3PCA3_9BASI|nr:hypothetical protein [Austropuccinia psidii MF-1]
MVRGPYAVVRGPWAVDHTLQSVGAIGGPLGPIFLGTQGYHGTKNWPRTKNHPTWPGPIDGVQDHQDPGLPKAAGEALGDDSSP